jgi:protein-S-isoprenylcysteine O-methyltransferase Ste14
MFKARRKYLSPNRPDVHQAVNRAAALNVPSYGIIPPGLGYIVIVLRTAMEDRLLYHSLAGYKEYAARVRYRLIPGVW